MLTYLSSQPYKTKNVIGQFAGLNERPVAGENEFADMKNMCDYYYPAIATRKKRGAASKTLAAPHGLVWRNGLFYVDGLQCYYDDEVVSGLTLTDGDKQLIGMGAYIVIFPDKIAFNTSTKTYKSLDATYTQSATATFAPLSTGSTYTKITISGINQIFNQYDAVTISGCTNATYNATKIITETGTDYIVVTGTLESSFTQASGLKFERKAPDLDYVCEYNNRLWGCSSSDHEIRACKLGDPFNWNVYEGISTDSYALTVGSDGDFTGCIAHLGYVLFFKEQYIHILYGDKPSNYSINTKQLPGVKAGCASTMQTISETLFYVGDNGVYAYNGAAPTLITEKLLEPITSAVGGQEDDIYYLSCLRNGKRELLTYDTKHELWHKEDDLEFLFTAFGEGELYYIDSNKNLATITGSKDEQIDWMMESVDMVESSLEQKYISKLMFNFQMESDAEANVFLKYDDGPLWERKGTIKSVKNMTYVLPVIPRRCGKYRYRIEGKGHVRLLGMSRTVEGGSEVHGSVESGYRK